VSDDEYDIQHGKANPDAFYKPEDLARKNNRMDLSKLE